MVSSRSFSAVCCVAALLCLSTSVGAVKGDPYDVILEAEKQQKEREQQIISQAAAKTDKLQLPKFENMLGQDFLLSVMSSQYGTFNATLRLKKAFNFPERLTGECVPHNEPIFQEGQKKTVLPHFLRDRLDGDDILPIDADAKKSNPKEELTLPKLTNPDGKSKTTPTLRPSFCYLELQLRSSDASEGFLHVFLLPARQGEVEQFKMSLEEGNTEPTFTIPFLFHKEEKDNGLAPSLLLNTVGLPRWASSTVTGRHGEKLSYHLRFFSEHEFSLTLRLSGKDNNGDGSEETMWVHGYTSPNDSVYNRHQKELPAWMRHGMLGIALLGFVVQLYQASEEGKKRKLENAKREAVLQRAQAKEKTIQQNSNKSTSAAAGETPAEEKKNQ
ncbi:hypothetical protein AGDE_11845 [Angomonas deanei]|nr:hypothetical protein AGDE_11845 [Angomonas deanei]|eukprot:EPY25362.1 hypothetical protein AGDE_11845 [Angomonas deanei]